MHLRHTLLALTLFAPVALYSQATEASITKQLKGMREMQPGLRAAASLKAAQDIASLPAGKPKVSLALGLAGLTTEIDAGAATLQAVADTLSLALRETPMPAKTAEAPAPYPYRELAKLVRYMHVTTTLESPEYTKASNTLIANEEDVRHADFTLKDLKGKPVTLSALKGKIVLVNFWATWCPPCRHELPDLDAIFTHYKDQLVILSITDEEGFKVASFVSQGSYHPPVLLDSDKKVHEKFHIEAIPQSFVFDKDGKLVDESIDAMTQRQFLMMLARAGLKPA